VGKDSYNGSQSRGAGFAATGLEVLKDDAEDGRAMKPGPESVSVNVNKSDKLGVKSDQRHLLRWINVMANGKLGSNSWHQQRQQQQRQSLEPDQRWQRQRSGSNNRRT
jgi:hypothetical protein